jgi:hypothetical protein
MSNPLFCWLAQLDLKKKNCHWAEQALTQMICANTSRYEQNML